MKKFITGFLLGAVLFTGMTTFAATNGNLIEVFYNIEDIVIEGKSKMPEQKPFVYNGSTYVPLKYVSENLGYKVGWDGKTKTVYVGDQPGENKTYPGKDIFDMNTSNFGIHYAYNDVKIYDNINNVYDSYILMHTLSGPNYIEFALNGEYTNFTALESLTQKFRSSTDCNLKIYLDDTLIYKENFKAGDMPENINLDITGGVKIKFEMEGIERESQIGLFNPVFTK